MVSYEHFRNRHEVNVAVNTAHVPHILSFEIRTVGPANDAYGNIILTCAHSLADVKLSIHITAFGVTHILTIHPHISGGVNTIKVEQHTFIFPTFRKREVAAITTHTVVQSLAHGYVRRIVGKGIVHINIERLSEARHFQASGNLHLLPA